MTVVMTVSSLPMAAFADPNGYNGGGMHSANVNGEQVTIGNDANHPYLLDRRRQAEDYRD